VSGPRHAQGAQQVPGLGILIQIDPQVGDSVAAGEVPEPTGVRVVLRPDDPQAGPDVRLERAAQDEGPQDEVSHRLVSGQEILEPFHANVENVGVGHGQCGHENRLSGQQRQVAQEPAGAVDGDQPGLRCGLLDHGDFAVQHHEEAAVPVALADITVPRSPLLRSPDPARVMSCSSVSFG
jgi:hypothetical protein